MLRQISFYERIRDKREFAGIRDLFPAFISKWDDGDVAGYRLEAIGEPWIRIVDLLVDELRVDDGTRITQAEALKILENLLDTMFDRFYQCQRVEHANGSAGIGTPRDLPQSLYFDRFFRRLQETKDLLDQKLRRKPKPPWEETCWLRVFQGMLNSKFIIRINGERCENAEPCLKRLNDMASFMDVLQPPYVCWTHGDLHFGNIYVNRENYREFKLVDPGGHHYPIDIAYDLGKLLHSFHGLYDFINMQSRCYTLEPFGKYRGEAQVHFHVEQYAWTEPRRPHNGSGQPTGIVDILLKGVERDFYKYLEDNFSTLMNNKIQGTEAYAWLQSDLYWEMRAEFNEAIDFCSMVPFHFVEDIVHEPRIDSERELEEGLRRGNVRKSIALYVRGVQLLHQFVKKYSRLVGK